MHDPCMELQVLTVKQIKTVEQMRTTRTRTACIMYWSHDLSYIETGISAKVLQNTSIWSQQMNSLRFFPDQNKVCYVVFISTGFKYLIRAGFYNGNYDAQIRPPTFDLQIDGNKWATIVTSLQQQPIFKEVIIMPLRNKTSICVARMRDGEIPFISSLEVIELPMILYRWMDPTYAMIKECSVDGILAQNKQLGG
ncbi:hypothetical protein AAC387_Pa03g2684 [Persea americana]